MDVSDLVLFIGLLVAVELTVFSWASHEKPEIQGRCQQEGNVRSVTGNQCIRLFSLNSQPPIFPMANTVQICQKAPESTNVEFATLFDTSLGIPCYSIYALNPVQVHGIGTAKRSDSWHKTEGITLQGSNAMYAKQPGPIKYQKGHVAPFNILSYSDGSGRASFTFTNAVPQVVNYNMGSWKQYEDRIVKFAHECAKHVGTIYLITGISEVSIRQDASSGTVTATRQPMSQSFPSHLSSISQKIAIPNSMWTAGCCVNTEKGVLGAFAVIGNNLPTPDNLVCNLGVTTVEVFIRRGANDQNIKLFPGHASADCYKPFPLSLI